MTLAKGQVVSIDGLGAFERPQFNGQTGTLERREPDTGRWRVRLENAPYMTVKVPPDALTIVTGSSSRKARDESVDETSSAISGTISYQQGSILPSILHGDLRKLDTVGKARWPLPPAVRVRQEMETLQPHVEKGALYKEIEREAPRAGGGAKEISRLRYRGLSMFREKEGVDGNKEVHPELLRRRQKVAEERRRRSSSPLEERGADKPARSMMVSWPPTDDVDHVTVARLWGLPKLSHKRFHELCDYREDCEVCKREEAMKEEVTKQRKAYDLVRPWTSDPPASLEPESPNIIGDPILVHEDVVDVVQALPGLEGLQEHEAKRRNLKKKREEMHKEKLRGKRRAFEKALEGSKLPSSLEVQAPQAENTSSSASDGGSEYLDSAEEERVLLEAQKKDAASANFQSAWDSNRREHGAADVASADGASAPAMSSKSGGAAPSAGPGIREHHVAAACGEWPITKELPASDQPGANPDADTTLLPGQLLPGQLAGAAFLWSQQEVEDLGAQEADWTIGGDRVETARLLDFPATMAGPGKTVVPSSRTQELEREFEDYEQSSRPATRGKSDAASADEFEPDKSGTYDGGWEFEED